MTLPPQTQTNAQDVEQQLRPALQNAYERLRKNELIIFCSLRSLPTSGSPAQLAKQLAEHDLKQYPIPSTLPISYHPIITPASILQDQHRSRLPHAASQEVLTDLSLGHQLPLELVAEIVDHVGDWELAKAVGLPTDLKTPRSWSRATKLDLAILSLDLSLVKETPGPFYSVSAKAAIRFSAVPIIDYLFSTHRHSFDRTFGQFLPLNASSEGSISVLEWWKRHHSHFKPHDSGPMDAASLNGHIHVLQWWVDSGVAVKYSEAALENASARGHLAVLNWWKESKLPLKIGRVMELASGTGHISVLEWWHRSGLDFKYDRIPLYHASCSGRVDSLEWWLQSGLQMIYDSDALVGATRHNKPESLRWWEQSGLPISYRLCDIEEALEDALGGGKLVRAWWENKGVDFKANITEWTKVRSLH